MVVHGSTDEKGIHRERDGGLDDVLILPRFNGSFSS